MKTNVSSFESRFHGFFHIVLDDGVDETLKPFLRSSINLASFPVWRSCNFVFRQAKRSTRRIDKIGINFHYNLPFMFCCWQKMIWLIFDVHAHFGGDSSNPSSARLKWLPFWTISFGAFFFLFLTVLTIHCHSWNRSVPFFWLTTDCLSAPFYGFSVHLFYLMRLENRDSVNKRTLHCCSERK